MDIHHASGKALYRINKFSVPAENRDAFLELMAKTHAVLRRQEGVVTDQILEQHSGPGVFNFVAIIAFTGPAVIDSVVSGVAAYDRETGIDRQQIMTALNIKTDMGLYHNLDI
ncbi:MULTISPECIES: antibiotic biosynthesis monooxygenase [unclassified Rhizobium]|uniref:putative quinol monooxygenase n=1 Tax=unclassified Rhizobium TaxID=2613769 RepID=UPI000A776F90|nr:MULTISPECIES: antibiotic biosynthesis monooxygenase [unclassified Rhizobium]